jgi:hypothetical protein
MAGFNGVWVLRTTFEGLLRTFYGLQKVGLVHFSGNEDFYRVSVFVEAVAGFNGECR